MSRFWLRLVSMLSLAAYFLANTNASLAMEHWLRNQARHTEEVSASNVEDTSEPRKKCEHCCKPPATAEDESTPPDRSGDQSSCPCCPNEPGNKACPCPGGCILCSVAKVPLLTAIFVELHQTICVGDCIVAIAIEYLSPECGGLDRPPRI